MAFSFFSSFREKREIEKKRQEEENRKYWEIEYQKMLQKAAEREKYCNWYSVQVDNFVNLLHEKGFDCGWGFETETEQGLNDGIGGQAVGNMFLFDLPVLEGVAFDEKSKQMLYYKFSTGFYSNFEQIGDTLQFVYKLIPFSDIYNANIKVDSQQVCSTVTSQNNVLVRSAIGGIIGGEVGAVIGGLTSPSLATTSQTSIPRKITFNILTIDQDYPVISMDFSKSWSSSGNVASNKMLVNSCSGTFSSNKTHSRTYERNITRKGCTTTFDRVYERCAYDVETAQEKVYPDGNLENILVKLKNYAMNIDSIIHRCNVALQTKEESNSPKDIIAELIKLSELKNQGIITEEEFIKLKAKLMQ